MAVVLGYGVLPNSARLAHETIPARSSSSLAWRHLHGRIQKHTNLALVIRRVPQTYKLVEGLGLIEHVPHVGHSRGVPGSDRLVEGPGVVEHVTHVGHGRSVPRANAFIEKAVLEQSAHVGNPRHVPVHNVPVGRTQPSPFLSFVSPGDQLYCWKEVSRLRKPTSPTVNRR